MKSSPRGRCIYESDPDSRLQYELKIKGMYFDFKPFLDELRAKRMKVLSEQGNYE